MGDVPMSEDDTEVAAAGARRLAPPVPSLPGSLTSLTARRGARVVVVAGPGVLAAGAASGVRTLAGITGATVVNTVGAKGLLAWDDPLHGGTVGLQADDAALAELTTADLVVTTGLDASESTSLAAALTDRAGAEPGAVVDVHPAHLALAAGGWPPADGPGPRPPIYDRIASVVGPLYAAEVALGDPVPPPQAARALADGLPPGGLVVAPPGRTGFWVGRTFPTSVAGSVVITTGDPAGTAEEVARRAASAGRPTTLVVDAHALPPAVADGSLLREATQEGRPLVVEVWAGPDAEAAPAPGRRAVRVDWSALDALVAVAGPPDASIWPGAGSIG
ncbi:hypothetical protein PO878_13515 [Iamia majanohamensis]|uniref:Thiamine pyrophosphate enzyme central domain-containing protein n=1 Tax=Iamia majanohamensis TaxID=467976 RepID=A0AAE9YCZ4_9ACTN|nr:hypothetical protein [Iamia majanohamensis]WCO65516.1 hypothetical protein PO878_13515 [Iamia majanohamensis]